ncbi:MAG: hypothetical protein J6X18_01060 [Bacteroidales bacterium]|nr:hypothetical protein [Bacteroidales bacterium]
MENFFTVKATTADYKPSNKKVIIEVRKNEAPDEFGRVFMCDVYNQKNYNTKKRLRGFFGIKENDCDCSDEDAVINFCRKQVSTYDYDNVEWALENHMEYILDDSVYNALVAEGRIKEN